MLEKKKSRNDQSWTTRLRKTLQIIETDYVVLLLDDFFLKGRVLSEKIEEHIGWMESNPRISMFCYKETHVSKNIRDNKYEGFERRPLFGAYKFNCQAALWNRKRLISYLKRPEDPWEWEVYGNWRSFRHPYHLFYSNIPGNKEVFPYTHELEGDILRESVYHGRWQVSTVDELFKKHGINIDYSVRGIVEDEEFLIPIQEKKRKEDAIFIKQIFWFGRPLYIGIKIFLGKTLYVMRHIDHFF